MRGYDRQDVGARLVELRRSFVERPTDAGQGRTGQGGRGIQEDSGRVSTGGQRSLPTGGGLRGRERGGAGGDQPEPGVESGAELCRSHGVIGGNRNENRRSGCGHRFAEGAGGKTTAICPGPGLSGRRVSRPGRFRIRDRDLPRPGEVGSEESRCSVPHGDDVSPGEKARRSPRGIRQGRGIISRLPGRGGAVGGHGSHGQTV